VATVRLSGDDGQEGPPLHVATGRGPVPSAGQLES
jgi:hypothetical protein